MTRIGDNQPSNLQTDSNNGDLYAGGRIDVEIYAEDGQRDVTYRGLYNHAEKAGLSHEERVKFAERWASDNLFHHENGKTRPYSRSEFAALKKKGVTPYDLNEQYSPNIFRDLRERQAAYRLSQQSVQPQQQTTVNITSVSAPKYNDAEKVVNWITDGIQSITGSESEIGKQFNRLPVSGLRLLGYLKEQENRLTETVNDAVRYVAPDSVDGLLDKADENNRQTATALKNASTSVTNDDRYSDILAEKEGIKRPLDTDLHRRLMYFPEAIPNAIDSAVKGDFKDDDGSYSDRVGKDVGGLLPPADGRDVVANIKNVYGGKPGAKVALGAAIIGAIPLVGDGAKILIKGNKEVIEEVVEGLVKTETKEIGQQTAKQADETFIGTLRGQSVELKNVEIKQIQYTKRARTQALILRKEFDNSIRSSFLTNLSDSPEKVAKLRQAGIQESEILKMQNGRNPIGWEVHHKLPLDDGGDNSIENLILILNEPYHKVITNAQKQLVGDLTEGQSRTVKFPIPAGNIYP